MPSLSLDISNNSLLSARIHPQSQISLILPAPEQATHVANRSRAFIFSLNSMEPKAEDKPIVQKVKSMWDQQKARDEEQNRKRERKKRADVKAEVAGCLSGSKFEVSEEAVVEYDSGAPVQ